jgi:hypothetical protein
MPRGRARKKPEAEQVEPELQKAIQAEPPTIDIKPERPTRKKSVVQVEKWIEEEPIEPDEDEDEEDGETSLSDFEEDSEQTAVFDDFLQPGADGKFIKVWKLPTYRRDGKTALRSTNRQFCDDLPVTPDYMQIIKNTWGPGVYQLELRDEYNRIVKGSRRMTIEIAGPQTQPITQIQTLPNGQQIPIVIEQQAPQQIPQQIDPLKQLRQAFSIVREFREELGISEQLQANNQPAQAAMSPKAAALEMIAENPEMMEKITKGIGSLVIGGKGGGDEDPWAEVAKEAVKNGEASRIVAAVIREIMAPFQGLFGGNNGQAQMAQTAPQTGAGFNSGRAEYGTSSQAQALPQVSQGVQPTNAETDSNPPPGAQITPEIQALQMLIDNCAQKVPPIVAAERLLAFEKVIEEQAPQYSITGYINILVNLDPDAALAFVNQIMPGSEAVTSLPHAKEWLIELQANLKGNSEGSEDET